MSSDSIHSKSPADNLSKNISAETEQMLRLLEITEGRAKSIKKQEQGAIEGFIPHPVVEEAKYHQGRTIFIPSTPVTGVIPPHSYNLGWGTGLPCSGPHCGVPVAPTMSGMQEAMRMSDILPQGATAQFPVGYRPGNSSDYVKEYTMYTTGTQMNPGPFRIKTGDI
jgi:hypothetical protein